MSVAEVTTPREDPPSDTPRDNPLWFLLPLVAALSTSLGWWADNWDRHPSGFAAILFAFLVALVSYALASLAVKGPGRLIGATALALLIPNWAPLPLTSDGSGQWAVELFMFVLVAYGLLRVSADLGRHELARPITAAVAGSMFVVGLLSLVGAQGLHAAELAPSAEPVTPGAVAGPDIYVVVLDAYGRQDVLANHLGIDNGDFVERIRSLGLSVDDQAWAPYSMTYTSLASTMSMTYPVEGDAFLDSDERLALYSLTQGDNPVVNTLQNAGYRYVHVEGGWGGFRCGAAADECVRARWEQTGWALATRTPLASLFVARYGHALSQAAVGVLDSLPSVVNHTATPQFTVAHVELPHPPLHTTAECDVEPDRALTGHVIGTPGMPADHLDYRIAAYQEQMTCVNDRVADWIEELSADSVVILIGDHGPDSRGQLLRAPDEWSEQDIDERMNVLLAARLPAHCPQTGLSGPNLFRIVFNCLFDAGYELLPRRQFIVSVENVGLPDHVTREITAR